MSHPKVRVGFVGVGAMGQAAHLRNYATLGDCEVVALAELRPALGRMVARKYNIPGVYSSHREMLEKETLDGIVASQPFRRHGTLLPELLAYKRPVFTEKPLAGSIAQGEKILQALVASGTWHMVGYHKRSDPATRWARGEIDRLKATGELGQMKYIRITMPAGDWIAGGFNDNIRGEDGPPLTWDPPAPDLDEPTNDAYIAFVNYYIHQVNLMRYLLGEPYHLTYADARNVLLVGESDSGVTCTIEMSPYATTLDWQESALVCFEKGWIRIDLPAPLAHNRPGRVTTFKDPGGANAPLECGPQLPWVHAMRQQAMNFVAAIRGQGRPPCEAAEALEDLKIARQYIRLRYGK